MTPTLAPSSALDATDRCDRCGAQAYVRVVLLTGGELLFCGHHWSRHADSLKDKARDVTDETHRLSAVDAGADA
ncbi:MAG: hypothetical protein WAO41_09290 [Candidatus Nanopelagicales bacterium]|jgi:hypothetical protein